MGLPRGGVPVAAAVARELQAPLDVVVVRKLGLPTRPELALGAIAEDGVLVLNGTVVRAYGVPQAEIERIEARERQALARRVRRFRAGRPTPALEGRTVVVVDDGLATGATAMAACEAVRRRGAAQVVMAVPIGAPETVHRLEALADGVVCLEDLPVPGAVSQGYRVFPQLSDAEVMDLLAGPPGPAVPRQVHRGVPPSQLETVEVPVDGGALVGSLVQPQDGRGLVVFAHGTGSGRSSPRNRLVARRLAAAGFGALLLDLLTESEQERDEVPFDVEVLGRRLLDALRWVQLRPDLESVPLGCFGASSGAAVALWAAADPTSPVRAVVSRGGRPDLARNRLERVTAPTLLLVGERDPVVLSLNRRALAQLQAPAELEVVPGAGHLFEEPGTMDAVADLTTSWFTRHLVPSGHPARG